VLALEKTAAIELRQTTNQATTVELQSFFDELRIVIAPPLREQGIDVQWDISPDLPVVRADRHSLTQVFLNLTKNSERVLVARREPWLRIIARAEDHRVRVAVVDNWGSVENPEQLFKPFQHHAHATELGLYLSRALMRSFGGEPRCEPCDEGAMFVVEIASAINATDEAYGPQNQMTAD
jgi:two-component system, LuxR family, sensor kinase FixL